LTLLAMIGLALKLRRGWPHRPHLTEWQSKQRSAPFVAWLFLAGTVLLPVLLIQVYDLTFWWEYGNGRGLQGRYWLGTIIPMLTFWTVGLLYFVPPRYQPAAHTTLRVGMVLFNIVALLFYILPRYYL
jgi:hypothetical protein